MPSANYSVGRDVTVVIILPDGTQLRLDKVTSFTAKPEMSKSTVKGLDGVTDTIPHRDGGWTGSIKTERRSATLDAYFATLEANYRAGISEGYSTIQQTIAEPDGSVSQWRFERVTFEFGEAGTWESDKTVSQSVNFTSHGRIKQA